MTGYDRILPRYPTRVVGVAGLKATTEDGVLKIGIDPASLQESTDPTAPGNYVVLLNDTTQELEIGELAGIVAAEAVGDYLSVLPNGTPLATDLVPFIHSGAVKDATIQAVVDAGRPLLEYDVRRFGAKLDGVTNDSAAFQAALDAAKASGIRAVVIPYTPQGFIAYGITVWEGLTLRTNYSGCADESGYSWVTDTATAPWCRAASAPDNQPIFILEGKAVIEGFNIIDTSQVWETTDNAQVFNDTPVGVQLGHAGFPSVPSPSINRVGFFGLKKWVKQYTSTDFTALENLRMIDCGGPVIDQAVTITRSGDNHWVENCTFHLNCARGLVKGDTQKWYTAAARNAEVFHLGRCDGLWAVNCMVYGVKRFAGFYKDAYLGDVNVEGGLSVLGGDIDLCAQGVYTERSAMTLGIKIDGAMILPAMKFPGVTQGAIIFADNTSNVRVSIAGSRIHQGGAPADGSAFSGVFDTGYVQQSDYAFVWGSGCINCSVVSSGSMTTKTAIGFNENYGSRNFWTTGGVNGTADGSRAAGRFTVAGDSSAFLRLGQLDGTVLGEIQAQANRVYVLTAAGLVAGGFQLDGNTAVLAVGPSSADVRFMKQDLTATFGYLRMQSERAFFLNATGQLRFGFAYDTGHLLMNNINGQGIVLKSPDGSQQKLLRINNAGAVEVVTI